MFLQYACFQWTHDFNQTIQAIKVQFPEDCIRNKIDLSFYNHHPLTVAFVPCSNQSFSVPHYMLEYFSTFLRLYRHCIDFHDHNFNFLCVLLSRRISWIVKSMLFGSSDINTRRLEVVSMKALHVGGTARKSWLWLSGAVVVMVDRFGAQHFLGLRLSCEPLTEQT